jgi:2-C-methyl-D-erythritol 4-phosphate cytidylyltransferase
MDTYAMIMAGGSGTRMNNPIPKQFLEVAGKPVIMHTFDIFRNYDPAIRFILVLPENEIGYWQELVKQYRFQTMYDIAYGGATRFHSVKNGLQKITSEGIVFIHDAVRPLVSSETLERCRNKAVESGNAVPVIPVSESVRKLEDHKSTAVDRTRFFLVQTPQTFHVSLIKKAYALEYSSLFTDDASVLEASGEIIHLVEGNRENIKITYPEETGIAEYFLNKLQKSSL